MANLRRHPRRFVTMAEAFEYTLRIPLREELARIFTAHYQDTAATYGHDAHDSLLQEMEVRSVVGLLEETSTSK